MAECRRYEEGIRRPLIHGGIGAGLILLGLVLGMKCLTVVLAVVGGALLAGGGWVALRIALGRSDHLVLEDTTLNYVHPTKPDRNRSVPLDEVDQVTIGTGTVGRVKELQVSVALKDGTKWTFGERFMDAARLQAFMEDLQDRLSRLP